jgi:hypothetical protein
MKLNLGNIKEFKPVTSYLLSASLFSLAGALIYFTFTLARIGRPKFQR